MSILSRSPALESVSSVRSLESMQSLDSAKSFSSAHSPGGESAQVSDYGDLNDIDMGRTIAKAPVVPAVVDGDVEKPSPTNDGPPNTCHAEREPAPNSTVEPAPSGHRKHDRFYMDPRTIKLVLDDGTLYRVFRQSFETHSTLFAEEYLVGCGEDEVIKLPGVSSVDLDRFLSLMYPSELATCELSSAQDWISVLRLAHRWSFPTLRARALREIELVSDVVDKIITAREFGDLDATKQWLLPAFTTACTADGWLSSITPEDAERLGARTILAIARIREDLRGGVGEDHEGADKDVDIAQAIVEARLAWAPPPASPMMSVTDERSAACVLTGGDAELPKLCAQPIAVCPPPADEDWPAALGSDRLPNVPLREDMTTSVSGDQLPTDDFLDPSSELLPSQSTGGGENDGPAPDAISGVDDSQLPSVQRAMLALSLSKPKAGESFSELRSRHARVSRIVDSILDGLTLKNSPKDLTLSLHQNLTPEVCICRVGQRIACLIAKELLLCKGHGPEQQDQDGPPVIVLCVTVPKGVKGAPVKGKVMDMLKEQHFTFNEDRNNARVLYIQIPRP